MRLLSLEPESSASAYSATSAYLIVKLGLIAFETIVKAGAAAPRIINIGAKLSTDTLYYYYSKLSREVSSFIDFLSSRVLQGVFCRIPQRFFARDHPLSGGLIRNP